MGKETADHEARIRASYGGLVKAGRNSVIAAWQFGKDCDNSPYTPKEVALMLGVSSGCVYRYLRLARAFQRAKLALEVAVVIESFNIDLIVAWRYAEQPESQRHSLRGRHFRYECRTCGGHDIGRDEVDEAGELVAVS